MTALTDADLDRIEARFTEDRYQIYALTAGMGADKQEGYVGSSLGSDGIALIAEIHRLRAAQITTLVACSSCGHGFRPIAMASPDDGERLCMECAESEIRRLRTALKERQDWSSDAVCDAVLRIREASASRARGIMVSPEDLRMLLASADGVADSYSALLEHTTGLTKPTTRVDAAIALADDRESERFQEWLAEELEPLRAALEQIARVEPGLGEGA